MISQLSRDCHLLLASDVVTSIVPYNGSGMMFKQQDRIDYIPLPKSLPIPPTVLQFRMTCRAANAASVGFAWADTARGTGTASITQVPSA